MRPLTAGMKPLAGLQWRRLFATSSTHSQHSGMKAREQQGGLASFSSRTLSSSWRWELLCLREILGACRCRAWCNGCSGASVSRAPLPRLHFSMASARSSKGTWIQRLPPITVLVKLHEHAVKSCEHAKSRRDGMNGEPSPTG